MLKNLPTMQGTWVQSLGREDPLYSCLETSTDRGDRWSTVPEITESDTTEQLTLSLQDSRGCCGRFKREGALQVLKATSAEELIFLSLGRERSERERTRGILGTSRIKNIQELKVDALSNLMSRESHVYNSGVSGKACYHLPTLGWVLKFQTKFISFS